MFLDVINIAVPYSLDPSYFKKTSLYLGKTIETGESEAINPIIAKKNKSPWSVKKLTFDC